MRCTLVVVASLSLATPAFSQDPVRVDPKHHKVEIDNANVRVLRITFAPGDKTPLHDHPAAIAVFLTDSQNRISPAGGQVDETPRKRGDVIAVAASKHSVENIGKTPVEIVLVEFKNPPMKTWNAGARDAVKVDPKHYTAAAENEHGRALKIKYGPNEKSVMHDHPPNVAVFLSTGKVTMHLPDGKTEIADAQRGGVQYSEAQSHSPETMADGVEAVVVELKTKAGAAAAK